MVLIPLVPETLQSNINMKVSELFESFNDSTSTLSNQVRHVNYSLIAVVWILSGGAVSGLKMDGNGTILLLILLSLFLDICQYAWTSVTVWFHARRIEKEEQKTGVESDDHLYPMYISWGNWAFFIAKIASCLLACVLLAVRLLK